MSAARGSPESSIASLASSLLCDLDPDYARGEPLGPARAPAATRATDRLPQLRRRHHDLRGSGRGR